MLRTPSYINKWIRLPIKATFSYKVETIVTSYLYLQKKCILLFKYINRIIIDNNDRINNGIDQNLKGSLNSALLKVITSSQAKIPTLCHEVSLGCENKAM